MTSIFNQYSFVLIGCGTLAICALILRRALRIRWGFVLPALGLIAALFLTIFLLFRPGSSDVDDFTTAQAVLANGRPTFVEFFSNFCTGCIAIKPSVDDLVTRIERDYNIMRVDIHSTVGRALRQQYGFSYTPEFVLFNADGREVWRAHSLPNNIDLALANPSSG